MEAYRRTRLPGVIDSNLLSVAGIPLSISDCILWLDATRITGLSDNDDLAIWSDLSGNSLDVTESTNKPKYRTSGINGLPSVQFGINTSTKLTSIGSPTVTYFSLFVVFYQIAESATVATTFQQNNQNEGIMLWVHTGVDSLYFRNPLGNDQLIGSIVIETNYVALFQHDTDIHAWLNGTEEATGGDTAVERTRTITIGNSDANTHQLNGYIGEIIWYDRSLTGDEITTINNYLIGKWQ